MFKPREQQGSKLALSIGNGTCCLPFCFWRSAAAHGFLIRGERCWHVDWTKHATCRVHASTTGKEEGDRHPKIRNGVLIGAGAKVLGNIEIGHCSKVASGSVVLADVPANSTVAGVPARVVGKAGCSEPSRTMDQLIVPEAGGTSDG